MPHQSQKSEEIHAGLSWTEGLGKYKLTKVITLAPRFIIKNNFSQPLAFREHGSAPRGRSTIEPGERLPLEFLRIGEEKLLTVAFPGLNAQWYVCLPYLGIVFDILQVDTHQSGGYWHSLLPVADWGEWTTHPSNEK